jgi:hypothetical protein
MEGLLLKKRNMKGELDIIFSSDIEDMTRIRNTAEFNFEGFMTSAIAEL